MRKRTSTKVKEPVRLRKKELSNGNFSLYLDFYRDGNREYEFLKLYLIPERNRNDKLLNEETLRTANAIKSQRIVALQNEEHGFIANNKAKASFIEYMKLQVENYKERDSLAYSDSIRATIEHLKKYKGENITLKQVDRTYLIGFINYIIRI